MHLPTSVGVMAAEEAAGERFIVGRHVDPKPRNSAADLREVPSADVRREVVTPGASESAAA